MKLGILVVFLVPPQREGLLRIHLERVRRHTSVPYLIYGVALRFEPSQRSLLEGDDIRLIDIPPTDLRGANEHAYYLERLLCAALNDGVTHIATLHVDSFPVGDRWAETLSARVSDEVPFATIERLNTACLFFTREFYERFRPPFLVPPEELEQESFAAFIRESGIRVHSGTGFALTAHRAGLRWYVMRLTGSPGSIGGPGVFDDLLFHLEGASRLAKDAGGANPSTRGLRRTYYEVLRVLRRFLPGSLVRFLRIRFPLMFGKWIDRPRLQVIAEDMSAAEDELFADPDRYIASMRRVRHAPGSA